MSLSNVQEAIERTLYAQLRKATTDSGYCVDIDDYDLENPDLTVAKNENQRYMADMKAIADVKGFAVEVFNVTTPFFKGNIRTPSIHIENQGMLPGAVGNDNHANYVDSGTSYTKQRSQDILSDYYFAVRLCYKGIKQLRVLHAIMLENIPRRGYIPWYTDESLRPSLNLLIRYVSFNDYYYDDQNIGEKVYRYEIPDIHEISPKELATIAKITQIDLGIYNDNGDELNNITVQQ